MSIFNDLSKIDLSTFKSDKDGLSYLPWSKAWSEFKKRCPDASYTVRTDETGRPYFYDESLGYMVFVTVCAEGEEHTMQLPVMDGKNKAMKKEPYTYNVKNKNFQYAKWDEERQGYYDKYGNEQKEYVTRTVEAATMFDINTAIMRCLVKAIALYGLGLNFYYGEDIPMTSPTDIIDKKKVKALEAYCKRLNITQESLCAVYQVEELADLTEAQFAYIVQNEAEILKIIGGMA